MWVSEARAGIHGRGRGALGVGWRAILEMDVGGEKQELEWQQELAESGGGPVYLLLPARVLYRVYEQCSLHEWHCSPCSPNIKSFNPIWEGYYCPHFIDRKTKARGVEQLLIIGGARI